jgi:methylphosphotriester-DNA--protein-cysteine methyltransferase
VTARKKPYRILTRRGVRDRKRPGRFAGWDGGLRKRIFGRLTCASGKRLMRQINRVFFASWEDAVAAGYRPCMKCRPEPDDRYERARGEWVLLPKKS